MTVPLNSLAQYSDQAANPKRLKMFFAGTLETSANTDPFEVRSTQSRMANELAVPQFLTSASSVMADGESSDTNRAMIQVQASIRNNVRSLPEDRHKEIFDDFAGAVETNDIGYLADTIVNWAFGGHGYDYVGVIVNPTKESPRAPHASERGYEAWQEFKLQQQKNNGEF